MPDESYQSKRVNKRTLVAAVLMVFFVPATFYLGTIVLNDRKYYFISVILIIYAMLPFAMRFESRKPKARELLVIAVLCAIAVAGRLAFFMIPQVKPILAVVIIAGICFGGEAGFLVGAVSGFVSNFFFGQGPWTPWQMFCLGVIGFAAGLIFQKGAVPKNKYLICLYGGLSAFFIYGGIMNPVSVLLFSSSITKAAVIASYISGFAFDLVHALSTVIFLFFIAEPMMEKLERIEVKYGLMKL